jgi:hypothetical protein
MAPEYAGVFGTKAVGVFDYELGFPDARNPGDGLPPLRQERLADFAERAFAAHEEPVLIEGDGKESGDAARRVRAVLRAG